MFPYGADDMTRPYHGSLRSLVPCTVLIGRAVDPVKAAMAAMAVLLVASAAPASRKLDARIGRENGVPVLTVNGRRRVPHVIYHTLLTRWRSFPNVMGKGANPSEELIKLARDHGYHLTTMPLPLVWPKDGKSPDYGEIDRIMDRHIELDPDVLTIPRLLGQPPQWWLDGHPAEREQFRVAPGRGEMPERRRKSVRKYVTPASTQWQEDYYRALRLQVRHLEAKYGNHVLGYHPGIQSAGENFYPLCWDRVTPVMVGFSEPFRQGFVRFAKERYGTIEAANRAWHREFASFDDIPVPTMEERVTGELGAFRNPATQRFALDFMTYFQRPIADAVIESCRIVKEETGGRKLTLAFFSSPQAGHCPLGASQRGSLALQRILESPHVDIVCNPYGYDDRQYGGVGLLGNLQDSIAANGKMYFVEDDTRTHLAPYNHFGKTKNMAQTKAVYTRLFAQTLQYGVGRWWFDFGSGSMALPELFEHFASMTKTRETFPLAPHRPEVAIVFDEESPLYLRGSNEVSIHSSRASRDYARMGAPFGRFLLSDVCAGRLPDETRIVFFMNAYKVDPRQREALHRALAKGGRTAVWFYAPGYIDGERADVASIRQLTGIRVEPLPGGTRPMYGLAKPLAGLAPGYEFGVKNSLVTLFAVGDEQSGVEPLARQIDGGRVGMAARDMDGWRSILFCGVRLDPAMFRALAREAGVHIYCDSNDSVSASSAHVAITALGDGPKTLRLPRRLDLFDIFGGESIARNADTVVLPMTKGETRILRTSVP